MGWVADFPGERMRFIFSMALILCVLFVAPAARSQGESEAGLLAVIPSGRLDYEVVREGERIGTHSVVIQGDASRFSIATRTDISIEFLGITLYRFRYDAKEEWIDGRLARLTSRTDNDGKALRVDLALANGRLYGTCNGTMLDLPASLLPVSVWHPDILRRPVLFDQYNCVERRVQTADQGIKPVVAKGQTLTARHYAMTGQLTRDIWYGSDGQTVQVRFPAKDGSEITFVLLASSMD
jgi:Domain of unknown function (DUF6134)